MCTRSVMWGESYSYDCMILPRLAGYNEVTVQSLSFNIYLYDIVIISEKANELDSILFNIIEAL